MSKEPTQLKPANRVDSETVSMLQDLLSAAKDGRVVGVFIVAKGDNSGFATNISENMRDFAGRGMIASAVTEEMTNNKHSGITLINEGEGDDE